MSRRHWINTLVEAGYSAGIIEQLNNNELAMLVQEEYVTNLWSDAARAAAAKQRQQRLKSYGAGYQRPAGAPRAAPRPIPTGRPAPRPIPLPKHMQRPMPAPKQTLRQRVGGAAQRALAAVKQRFGQRKVVQAQLVHRQAPVVPRAIPVARAVPPGQQRANVPVAKAVTPAQRGQQAKPASPRQRERQIQVKPPSARAQRQTQQRATRAAVKQAVAQTKAKAAEKAKDKALRAAGKAKAAAERKAKAERVKKADARRQKVIKATRDRRAAEAKKTTTKSKPSTKGWKHTPTKQATAAKGAARVLRTVSKPSPSGKIQIGKSVGSRLSDQPLDITSGPAGTKGKHNAVQLRPYGK